MALVLHSSSRIRLSYPGLDPEFICLAPALLCFLPLPSFDVSLTCGRASEKEEPLYDVALKLTARFTDRQFLRSARVSGKWVGEEVSTAYFPFIPDQPFRVNNLVLVAFLWHKFDQSASACIPGRLY